MPKKTEKEKKAVRAAVKQLEATGYQCFFCPSGIFDILAELPFLDDKGTLIKVEVDSIEPDILQAVKTTYTKHNKRIMLRRFGSSKNDPGRFYSYFFEDDKLIRESPALPLKKAMSRAKKVTAAIPKGRAKSRNTKD